MTGRGWCWPRCPSNGASAWHSSSDARFLQPRRASARSCRAKGAYGRPDLSPGGCCGGPTWGSRSLTRERASRVPPFTPAASPCASGAQPSPRRPSPSTALCRGFTFRRRQGVSPQPSPTPTPRLWRSTRETPPETRDREARRRNRVRASTGSGRLPIDPAQPCPTDDQPSAQAPQ